MKEWRYLFPILVLSCGLYPDAPSALAQAPEIVRPVTDLSGVMTPRGILAAENMLVRHREQTGVQISVLVVETTGDLPIEEFSRRAAEAWSGGARGLDDGVLFTLAVRDRRMRMEVGYGLESYLPDAACSRIEGAIQDDLKGEKYDQAVLEAVEGIVTATASYRPGEPLKGHQDPLGARVPWTYLAVFGAGSLGTLLLLLRDRFTAAGTSRVILLGTLGLALPLFIAAVFRGGPAFWWAYPLVYYVAMILAFMIWGIHDTCRWCAWAFAGWLYVVVPSFLAWNRTFRSLDPPEGVGVLTLLIGHVFYCGLGSLLGPLPYLMRSLSENPPSGTFGSSGYRGHGSLMSLGASILGSGPSWGGGGGRFGGGGATSSW